jgi:DnaJ-class molecular chaperone
MNRVATMYDFRAEMSAADHHGIAAVVTAGPVETEPCRSCGGTGTIVFDRGSYEERGRCSRCGGTGRTRVKS